MKKVITQKYLSVKNEQQSGSRRYKAWPCRAIDIIAIYQKTENR